LFNIGDWEELDDFCLRWEEDVGKDAVVVIVVQLGTETRANGKSRRIAGQRRCRPTKLWAVRSTGWAEFEACNNLEAEIGVESLRDLKKFSRVSRGRTASNMTCEPMDVDYIN
jgi:hypothetical protein